MNNLSMYIARESGLHNLHPLTKSLLVLCLLAAGLALPGRWTGYIIFLIFIVPLAIWGKIFRRAHTSSLENYLATRALGSDNSEFVLG